MLCVSHPQMDRATGNLGTPHMDDWGIYDRSHERIYRDRRPGLEIVDDASMDELVFDVGAGLSPPVLTPLYDMLNSYRHDRLLCWFDDRKRTLICVSHPEMDCATGNLGIQCRVYVREVEGIEGPDWL